MVSQAAFAGGLFPKVLVSVAPLAPYTDEILRGLGSTQSLLRAGQDPHSFALSPSQARALDEADILIVPDIHMNPVLASMVAKKKHLRVIDLSTLDGADPLPYTTANPWLAQLQQAASPAKKSPKKNDSHTEHAHGTAADTSANDPHFWLDPERMAALAPALASAIAETTPEARTLLRANAQQLATHLRQEVIPPLRTMLSAPARTRNALNQPEIPFITYHAAYQYFLARFNLTHHGEITTRPEDTMGAQSMVRLLSGAEGVRVRCLIGEQETTLMARIAKASGARIVLLSPEQLVDRTQVDALDWLKNDYDRLLYTTAKAFAACL
jgi:zinc transport system substrate-binding protein